MQRRLIVSWNECLSLWSRKWLKLTRSRVRYFIPLGLGNLYKTCNCAMRHSVSSHPRRILISKHLTTTSCLISCSMIFHAFGLGWFKGLLSGLRQFLANESSLKIMKNIFYFIAKALFALKIFKFLSWIFVHMSKRLD